MRDLKAKAPREGTTMSALVETEHHAEVAKRVFEETPGTAEPVARHRSPRRRARR